MKKQTAVEFLVEQLEVEIILTDKDVENVIKQAKEMEKEQIIDSLHYFGIENAQDYYNETYGGQDNEQ